MDNLISYLNGDSNISNFLTLINPKTDIFHTIDSINTGITKSLTITKSIINNSILYSLVNKFVVDSTTSDLHFASGFPQGLPKAFWRSPC